MNQFCPPTRSEASKIIAPFRLRFFRRAAWTGLAAGLVFVFGLAIAPVFFGGEFVPAMAIGLGALVFTVVLRRLPARAWYRIALGYAGLAGVFAYLGSDDISIRRPLTLEEFAPAFPGAEKSYEVLMRYGRGHLLGRDFRFQTPKFYQAAGAGKPLDPHWREWVTTNRTDLETNWAKLEPVRQWWSELNTFERIGDLTPPREDAEILAFAPIRTFTQHACAIASLQAIDGKGDAAFETLLPVLEVGRKLQPSSRTLVRTMVASIVQKMSLETAQFILDTTPVSPGVRARFAAAVNAGTGGEVAARRLVAVEYAWSSSTVLNRPIGNVISWKFKDHPWAVLAINPLSRFVFNSRRTINLYGDLTAELQELAANREITKLEPRMNEFLQKEGGMHFKNLGGSVMLADGVPAYSKVIETYWKIEDLRTALQVRLQS